MESKKNKRPKPYDEMSTTGAMTRVTDGPRPKPYDEMSTTGALSQSSDVTRSLRPIARPERQGATKEGLNPAKSSLRPIARPARKPTADQQELIDYVDDLRMRIGSNVPSTGPRPVEVNEMTPIGKPRTMGERMRDAGAGHQGRPAKKFKDGGMVRGAKPGQTSGTKFSGTF
jgi:hypothetical protein